MNHPTLEPVPLGQEFVLKLGQEAEIKHTKIKVIFDSVVADGRCPIEVDCYWAGNAEVQLVLKYKQQQMSAIVNTGLGDRDREYRGYRIELLKLNPDKHKGLQPSQYEARLQVNRIKQGRVF